MLAGNFITVNGENYATLDWLARVTRRAADEGLDLRIASGVSVHGPYLLFALGQGAWSSPLYTTTAPEPVTVQPRLSVGPNGEPVVTDA